jgi:hypothetical protein
MRSSPGTLYRMFPHQIQLVNILVQSLLLFSSSFSFLFLLLTSTTFRVPFLCSPPLRFVTLSSAHLHYVSCPFPLLTSTIHFVSLSSAHLHYTFRVPFLSSPPLRFVSLSSAHLHYITFRVPLCCSPPLRFVVISHKIQ